MSSIVEVITVVVALQRFRVDLDILAELVNFDKGAPQEEGMGTEEGPRR